MFQRDLLKGKRILVTGGGTGLGKVMAEKYLELGAVVYICGRRLEVLDETAKELTERHGGEMHTRALDIRNAEAVDEVIGDIFSEGPLDGLINNAAGNFVSPTKDLSPRGFNAIASIVFHGTFYVTHAVGTRWIEAEHPGSIISIITTWVWTGSAFVVPSAMSKAGINVMTKSLAAEWARYRIRLNCIAPGPFPTKGAWERLNPSGDGGEGKPPEDRTVPWGRFGEMHELANLAAFLMADGCDFLTGQTIAIDGGQHLAAGGSFYQQLADVTDEEWTEMREKIRAANERDKAKRAV